MIKTVLSKTQFSYREILMLVFAFALWQSSFAAKVYIETGGILMMEAENTESTLDLWKRGNITGSSGTGNIEFTGNTPEGVGSQRSPLLYTFKIVTAGNYALIISGRRSDAFTDGRKDIANDCYVRLEGNYTLGVGGPPNVSYLKQDEKMFIGRGGYVDATGGFDWRWGDKLDIDGLSTQPKPIYNFKAGETYTLFVSGRSTYFALDRIVFVEAAASQTTARALTTESNSFDDGALVERYSYEAINHFAELNAGVVPFYKDGARSALAINASVVADRDKYARATTVFTGKSDKYDVTLTTLSESDGECSYRFVVNGVEMGTYQNSRIVVADEYKPQAVVFKAVQINKNDLIAVEANTHTNKLFPENGGTAWARGRWTSVSMSPAVYQGRIAVVADGNYRDADDIIGTPVTLAILRSFGLEKKLVHYSHSCDLKPGSNDPGGKYREEEMQLSCDGTASRWGGFEHITFFNCMTQKAATLADLIAQINASTETDPLWIIEAGEPDIMWEAINACIADKRSYIHIVTHHPANDVGDDHDLSDVMALGVPSSNLHGIPDQNTLLKTPLSDWYWARDNSDDRIKWLWSRGYTAQTAEMDYPAIVGKFDCSDAGMIYYWATIEEGGDIAPDVPKLKALFLNYLKSTPAKVAFISPKQSDMVLPGTNLAVEAELTVNTAEIDSVTLFINDVKVRTIVAAPFLWGSADVLLKNIQPGTYNLKLVATDTASVVSEAFFKIEVPLYAYFISPKNGDVVEAGNDIMVEAGVNVDASLIASIELFVNETLVRKITEEPFTWGFNDEALKNRSNGAYTLKLLATTTANETSVSELSVTVESIPVQAPFTGSAIVIPGKIEAENYDLGGEGLAYHDNSSGNQSGEYRDDDVDIGIGEAGSYVIGNALVGEWTEYTVNVEADGKYNINLRYSSGKASGGASIGLAFKDEDIVLVPGYVVDKTANWQTYETTVVSNVALTKGLHVLRMSIVMNGLNIDWLEFVRTDDVAAKNIHDNTWEVFPNPSCSGVFKLHSTQKWEVYSALGNQIMQGEGNCIDLSRFAKGMYLVKAQNEIQTLLFE